MNDQLQLGSLVKIFELYW